MDDIDIIREIKSHGSRGDTFPDEIKTCFEELYNRYYSQCYNIARYYGMKKQDAEEVVQDSFIKLLKRIKNFDESRPFKPYLFKIILNTVRDKYREIIKYRHTSIDSIIDEPENNQENLLESLHTRGMFYGIIIRMPEKIKEVILLRNFSGLMIEEISEAKGISKRQIHNLLNKGYDLIKHKLEDN